jgi:uncharacterized membrane protein YfcA
MLELFLLSLLLGAIAGFLAGLFGLGGGVLIVPMLVWLFSIQAFPREVIMIMALATSLATIIFTSTSSMLAHQKLGTIKWDRVLRLSPGILLGAGTGAVVADHMTTDILTWLFISYLFYVGFRMALQKSSKSNEKMQDKLDYIAGVGIGLLSSLLGIGGGSLTVPYLVGRHVQMKNAVAISSACGLPIAVSAVTVYIVLGWEKTGMPEWSFGYVYLPAMLGIIIFSILTAPLGAKLANKLPAQKLKRYFSIVIFLIAFKMILS